MASNIFEQLWGAITDYLSSQAGPRNDSYYFPTKLDLVGLFD